MTFEEKLALAKELNKKIASGQVAGQIATSALIREDGISDEDLADLVYIYPKWKKDLPAKAGDLYRHMDKLYEVIQPHTTQADWAPDVTPALWKPKQPVGVIPDFVKPTGAHDAYMTGDKVLFNGTVYTSNIDNNTWSPTDYPQGWTTE